MNEQINPNMLKRVNRNTSAYLRNMRIEAGVTLREVAKVSGYDDSYWCMLENGQRTWSLNLIAVYRESVRKAAVLKRLQLERKMQEKMAELAV